MESLSKKRVVCVIPARYASARLPGKPLIEIKGLPLIMWTYNQAVKSGAFDDVYVATDDERIQNTVERYEGKSVMTSRKHTSGTDRVFEAIQGIDCKYIVNLQGDEPQMRLDILRDFTENLIKLDNLSLLTCVSNATIEEMNDPNVVKAVLAANGDALYFSRAPIPFVSDDTECKRYKHVGIYGFSRESLEMFCNHKYGNLEKTEKLEQLRALERGMKIHCLIQNYDSISIDTRKDLDAFRLSVGESES